MATALVKRCETLEGKSRSFEGMARGSSESASCFEESEHSWPRSCLSYELKLQS